MFFVVLIDDGEFAVLLTPERTTFMASSISIAQLGNLAIVAADAAGDVVSPITFDSPPVWTNSNNAAATLVASADGSTAVLTSVAEGTTTVGVTAVIGGSSFTASLDVAVTAGAVASISLTLTPAPKS